MEGIRVNDTVIIDYGVGNIASIANMMKKAGRSATLSKDHAVIRSARRLILPGVGSFDHAATRLAETGIDDVVREQAAKGVPILGVCLGMQLLLDRSDEGELAGLGLVPGASHKFPSIIDGERLRVPHMGWNTVRRTTQEPLSSVQSDDRFYFVHSYYVKPVDDAHVIGVTQHGIEFASMIRNENVIGVQFHPEKSHRYGLKLLNDFAEEA